MDTDRRTVLHGAAALAALGLTGGVSKKLASSSSSASAGSTSTSSQTSALTLDHTAWQWDETNDVYYQLGITYVTNPATTDYENLGIYVPGAYLSATANSDGSTYTATINRKGSVGSYRATNAPLVFPVNTPGYAAQNPPTSYSYDDVSDYLEAGLIYVWPGLRGRDGSTSDRSDDAPWGVVDLKAAVRYIRYNADLLPGDQERVVVFGMSGGGAQTAVMGASGDSELYTPYLNSIGAAMTKPGRGRSRHTPISDAIAGAMAWCPITNLDYANAAYEWNMGQFGSTDTRASGTWTSAYSADLSEAFAAYQNKLDLRDKHGKRLKLTKSSDGIYLSGSYYDHLISVITTSLNNFLSDNTFPYTMSSGGGPGSTATSTTYDTVEDYIDYLNTDSTWVTYDSSTNTAKVLSLSGFVESQKSASKPVGAFDGVSRGQTENLVFGFGTTAAHFAPVSRDVIAANQTTYATYSDWSSDYAASEYTSDFAETDSVGKKMAYRADMYNPLYYLTSFYRGYGESTVAPHWRIRTGIMQGDTANTTEVNLALALESYRSVRDVDFATVWGLGHTEAERTGDSTTNFIEWVESTVAN
ncbi:MAG: carboxylesterase family protein [Nocardioides sp.]|uniref:esterase n=1 Tax=Nocardioides sp. TaxID=35761 RepID=UPI0039E43D47